MLFRYPASARLRFGAFAFLVAPALAGTFLRAHQLVAAEIALEIAEAMRRELTVSVEHFEDHPTYWMGRPLLRALTEAGPVAIPVIEEMLADASPAVNELGLEALLEQDADRVGLVLRRVAVSHPNESLRRRSLERLRELDATAEVRDGLLAQLGSESRELRLRALRGLWVLRDGSTLAALEPFFDSPDAELRRLALEAVGGWSTPIAHRTVLGLLRSDRFERRVSGVVAAYAYYDAKLRENDSPFPDYEEFFAAAATPPGATHGSDDPRPPFAPFYVAGSSDLQAALLAKLAITGRRPEATFSPLLLSAARAPGLQTRRLAALLLTDRPDEKATDALKRLLRDPDAEVRYEAAAALAFRGDPIGVPLLLEASDRGYDGVQREISLRLRSDTVHPPPPLAEAAMAALTGASSADWRQWWREHDDGFDPLAAHVEVLLAAAARQADSDWPSNSATRASKSAHASPLLIGTSGTVATADVLLQAGLSSTSYHQPLWDAVELLARRLPRAAARLATAVAARESSVDRRRTLLRLLHDADPERARALAAQLAASTDESDLQVALAAAPYASSAPYVEALLARLPESPQQAAFSFSPYTALSQVGDRSLCPRIGELALAEADRSESRGRAIAALVDLGCDQTLHNLSASLIPPDPSAAGPDLEQIISILALYREPRHIPALIDAFSRLRDGERDEQRRLASRVAAILDVRTVYGAVRSLAADDPNRRLGGLFLLELAATSNPLLRDGYSFEPLELRRQFVRPALVAATKSDDDDVAARARAVLRLFDR